MARTSLGYRALSAVAVLSLATIALAQDRVAGKEWSLDVPAGWVRYSAEEIAALNADSLRRMPTKNFEFVAGFRAVDAGDDGLPYVLIQETKLPGGTLPTFEELEEYFGAKSGDLTAEAKSATADIFKSLELQKPVIDRAKARMYVSLSIDLGGGRTIKGLCVGQFTAGAMPQVNLYADAATFEADSKRVDEFVGNLRVLSGFEFVPGGQSTTPGTGSKLGGSVLRGAAIGAAVGLAYAAVAWFRKRSAGGGSSV